MTARASPAGERAAKGKSCPSPAPTSSSKSRHVSGMCPLRMEFDARHQVAYDCSSRILALLAQQCKHLSNHAQPPRIAAFIPFGQWTRLRAGRAFLRLIPAGALLPHRGEFARAQQFRSRPSPCSLGDDLRLAMARQHTPGEAASWQRAAPVLSSDIPPVLLDIQCTKATVAFQRLLL
jgi:hypothetical protein